jgi:hypothetical protein
MATLSHTDKMLLEYLLEMNSGYVLDFSNRTFKDFFYDELDINIDDPRYYSNTSSNSKANRMRCFWRIEGDVIVGKSIDKLIEYKKAKYLLLEQEIPEAVIKKIKACEKISLRLINGEHNKEEDEFLHKNFSNFSIQRLKLFDSITGLLEDRLSEAKKCFDAEAYLAVIFLCGRVLEGLLFGMAEKNNKKYNQSCSSPKTKEGKTKPFNEWTLSELIDVSCKEGFIGLDVKKFSLVLREFRNYIHPRKQLSEQFKPTKHTAAICIQVVKAAIVNLSIKILNYLN